MSGIQPPKEKFRSPYSQKTLTELFSLIVQKSERSALDEVLSHRKVFTYEDRSLLFSDFLGAIRKEYLRKQKQNYEIIDCTYDKTLDKFTNLPVREKLPEELKTSSSKQALKRKSIDCRNYYRAVLSLIANWKKEHLEASRIDEEVKAARIFQGFVVKHFYWSLEECWRQRMPFSIRYFWKIKGKKIILRHPVYISGREFGKWLEANVRDADPDRPGERSRIQRLVDEHFLREYTVPFDDPSLEDTAAEKSLTLEEKSGFQALAETVAKDKVENIETMRPAIKKLGEQMLYELVLRIFENLSQNTFEDSRIARDFGLSKSAFSRFAGSKWSDKLERGILAIPDLWSNTAKILASIPDFLEVAANAGVLPKLKKVLQKTGVDNG